MDMVAGKDCRASGPGGHQTSSSADPKKGQQAKWSETHGDEEAE